MTAAYLPSGSSGEPANARPSDVTSLQLEFERFRLLVENSQDLIAEVTHDGLILYVSPNIRAVLGFEPHELVGTSLFARVHPADRAHAEAQFRTHAGRATGRHRHRDGSWRWLEVSARQFAAPDGAAHRVLIARDVTAQRTAEAERDRLETELARAEKLTALGTLSRGIAHDFNNILTGIIAYTNLARLDTRQREVIDALNQVLRASDRAKHLVQQILTFSRQQKPTRQAVRLVPLVHEVLELMKATFPSTLEVVTDLRDPDARVLADATQVHQVIVNLCSNAVHAMRHRPGRLEVKLSIFAVDLALALEQPGLQSGAYARLTIADNGHGMDAATRAQIFEPFFTTKPAGEGTGLGLAVVRQIVSDHDGAIRVASELGQGTTVEVFLPLAPAATTVASAAPPQNRTARILLVDDEANVCAAFTRILESAGHVVTSRTDALHALDLLRAQPTDFDLVLTDLAMPGLTGVDLAAEGLKLNPSLPFLLMSGLLDTWTAEKARWIGIRDVLMKPIDAVALLKSVTEALTSAADANPVPPTR